MLYMVLRIETDFDAVPGEDDCFPVVDYPDGAGCGYADGEFLISGGNPLEVFNNYCKLYDLRRHVAFYKYEDSYGIDEDGLQELDRIERIIGKAEDGTIDKDDLLGLSVEIWTGEIQVLHVANNRLVVEHYPEINDLTGEIDSVAQEEFDGSKEEGPTSGNRSWTRAEATAWLQEWRDAAREGYKEVHGIYPD